MTLENLRELKKIAYAQADSLDQYVCIHVLDAIVDGIELFGESQNLGQAYFDGAAKTALENFLCKAGITDAKTYGDKVIIWELKKPQVEPALKGVIWYLQDKCVTDNVLNLSPVIDFSAEYKKCVEEKAKADRDAPFRRNQWLHSEESKFFRRYELWQWLKWDFFKKHRRDVAISKILLVGMAIGGYSPAEVLDYSREIKIADHAVEKLFASIGVSLHTENFSEEDIVKAEQFIVDIVKNRFVGDIATANSFVSAYFDEVVTTPLGIVYKSLAVDSSTPPPTNFISEPDAAKMLGITEEEFKQNAQNVYDLRAYETQDNTLYYDYDAVKEIAEIIQAENQPPPTELSQEENFQVIKVLAQLKKMLGDEFNVNNFKISYAN